MEPINQSIMDVPQGSRDSNHREVYSYETNVTALAGADFINEGKMPL